VKRRLTELQRRILLTMLEHEEKEEEKLGFEKGVNVEFVTKSVAVALEQERNPGPTGCAEEVFGEYVARGCMELEVLVRNFRGLFEAVRRCMRMMEERDLLLRVIVTPKERFPLIIYKLSPRGRLLAKMLRFEKSGKVKVDASADELIEKAVKVLREEKAKNGQPPYATATEILEKLWQLSPELYENERRIFDKYWNKKKLGEKLKEKCELVEKTLNGKRIRVYELYSRKEKSADLQAALVSIRRENFWRATTEDIKDALWKVCGAKFASKEVFEKVWNERLIGRLMRERKLPRRRKYVKTWHELADGTIIPVSYNIWLYDIRTVPKDEEGSGTSPS